MKTIFCAIILFWVPAIGNSQSIKTTKHNLSVTGPGTYKASSEEEICVFCHTPHNGDPLIPLWNRNVNSGAIYTKYSSNTMKATVGQPTGTSILCLSCHDGTIALGEVFNRGTISFASGTNITGNSNLGTDLRNDHPISFTYDVALTVLNTELKNPTTLIPQIKLENNQLQCTACHDPHVNLTSDFLVATSQNSTLCVACHDKTYWAASSHNTSVHTWNSAGVDPWPYSVWTTVAENACENCHNPHNSGATSRLLKHLPEEDNCLDCHNGNAATKDVSTEFSKAYKHNVYGYTSKHSPTEAANPVDIHVECEDCHNPHATKSMAASAPAVRGSNIGVIGINQSGVTVNPVTNEYEICYRCHSASAVTASSTARKIDQNDVRLEFDGGNPSYHPIAVAGKNLTIAGLIGGYTAASIIYCTDCHASNGVGAPGGPHGSIYPQILKYNYNRTSAGDSTTAFAYELCYQCHDQTNTITKHATLGGPKNHANETSCNTCHDPHGISNSQGNSTNNSFLVNFNTAVVTPNSGIALSWTLLGAGSGKCNLACHGHDHVNSTY